MEQENVNISNSHHECCKKHHRGTSSGDVVYCLGFIGAVIYFISTAATFWIGVLGVLKAIVWPVFAVYELFKFFHL